MPVKTTPEIAADFDRIAAHSPLGTGASGLARNETSLLEHAPRSGRALDLGCGTGEATRFLARRGLDALGIDVSAGMIARAEADPRNPPSVSFELAEALEFLERGQSFDCIVAIAVLHHLEPQPAIARMKDALRPGGSLLILDLLDRRGPRYLALNALARSVRFLQAHRSSTRRPPPLRRAWRDHGAAESYLTPEQARALARTHFPGGQMRHHLFWRYSIRWTNR